MSNLDILVYNISVFISTLFLLEYGADKFIDHTAIVAHRTGISPTLISLLTAGAEWEELAVVIASLLHKRPSLALGNIVGSAISNILGAFSLGLLFQDQNVEISFDRSSRIYSLVLLILTTLVIPVVYFKKRIVWLVGGSVLIAIFAVYIASVGWAINKGTLTAPEDSDDDDSSDEGRTSDNEECPILDNIEDGSVAYGSVPVAPRDYIVTNAEGPMIRRHYRKPHALLYHVSYLFFGFLAISLSGFLLSHAATTISEELGLSDVLFGVVILSIATTLPEKFIAVLSGSRGYSGILVANTAGSNIILLTLCLSIVMLDTGGTLEHGNVNMAELGTLWLSTLVFTITVWYGRSTGWIGGGMLVAYVVFIVLEFTVFH
jgi:Ca2+/Na+ antiporter